MVIVKYFSPLKCRQITSHHHPSFKIQISSYHNKSKIQTNLSQPLQSTPHSSGASSAAVHLPKILFNLLFFLFLLRCFDVIRYTHRESAEINYLGVNDFASFHCLRFILDFRVFAPFEINCVRLTFATYGMV